MILNVTKAEYIDGFRIKVMFNDGNEKVVDLKEYIYSKKHPYFQPLKEIEEFKKFKVHRTIIWESGADIAPEFLRDEA